MERASELGSGAAKTTLRIFRERYKNEGKTRSHVPQVVVHARLKF